MSAGSGGGGSAGSAGLTADGTMKDGLGLLPGASAPGLRQVEVGSNPFDILKVENRLPDPMPEDYLVFDDFTKEFIDPAYEWSDPKPYKAVIADKCLRVVSQEKVDFWRHTYYSPRIVKNDGHLLHIPGITEPDFVLETSFLLTPLNQFDQAGIMVYYSEECWVKAGLEYVDGVCRLSSVVTNGHSDWATQPWEGFELRIRVHKVGSSFVCEYYQPLDDKWHFMRIFHLREAEVGEGGSVPDVKLGLMTCAPSGRGMIADFHYLLITKGRGYEHTADPGEITYFP